MKRLKKYQINTSEFVRMVREQHNSCAICGKKGMGETLHIDHNHETGAVRGLLCLSCNVLLGHAKDNTNILKSAIEYLEKYSKPSGTNQVAVL